MNQSTNQSQKPQIQTRRPISNYEYLDPTREDDSIVDGFRYKSGRRYHFLDGVKYPLPCDTEETYRLKLNYSISRYCWKGNIFYSPLENELAKGGMRVLDDQQPSNVGFLQCNIHDGLPFPDDTFDFVFMSHMFTSITESQWQNVVDDLVRVAKPGGWIELMESDYINPTFGPVNREIQNQDTMLLISRGINMNIGPSVYKYFENIDELEDEIFTGQTVTPLGNGTVGELASHFAVRLHEYMGISTQELEEKFKICQKEMEEYNTVLNIHRFYVQKKICTEKSEDSW
ncbi:12078_t:CDS:2 [Racocetra fulgida]|uniref:12078_t:CDS:1 n=1 Tax=Racocetra fulgida TaxID=60492 RepID=A0A9N9N6I6_9GLOM|nr:12078_t:CDS:2 [Racocetra fulgida]